MREVENGRLSIFVEGKEFGTRRGNKVGSFHSIGWLISDAPTVTRDTKEQTFPRKSVYSPRKSAITVTARD